MKKSWDAAFPTHPVTKKSPCAVSMTERGKSRNDLFKPTVQRVFPEELSFITTTLRKLEFNLFEEPIRM